MGVMSNDSLEIIPIYLITLRFVFHDSITSSGKALRYFQIIISKLNDTIDWQNVIDMLNRKANCANCRMCTRYRCQCHGGMQMGREILFWQASK